ncbi:proline dehydrogenase [Blastocladiella emersonii ATCC 22665]|nr:proline dehydrogenase [Blastocladiella emersonii ATCC 22665]
MYRSHMLARAAYARPPQATAATLLRAPAAARGFATAAAGASAKPAHSPLCRAVRAVGLGVAGATVAGGVYLGVQLALADPADLARAARASLPSGSLYADVDLRAPFAARSTASVITSLAVYQACGWKWLVDAAPKLLATAESLGLAPLAHWIIKHSFFAHFCGGEDLDELAAVMAELKAAGIGSILDISIESDIGETTNADADPAAVRAKDELEADHARDLFVASIDAAAREPGSCIALKVTALGPTPVLLAVSGAIARTHRLLESGEATKGLTKAAWTAAYPSADAAALFDAMDADRDGRVHAADLVAALTSDPSPRWIAALGVAADDVTSFAHLVTRLRALCDQAKRLGVGLMVDAEQTYFQDAIDAVALAMGREFNGANGGAPVVYNTYQMYLKAGLPKLQRDVAMSERQGWHFAAKLVRGAYMVSERAKAADEGYASPINDTLEATHASYNAGVDAVLTRIHRQSVLRETAVGATFMVASHNRDSVVRTLDRMRALGLPADAGRVLFGQLKGMHDLTGYALAAQGFKIFKYLPYGPVHEVIPYLLRRAQENSGMLGGAQLDRMLLWHELVCRVKGV